MYGTFFCTNALLLAVQVQHLNKADNRGNLLSSGGSPPDAPSSAAVPAAVAQLAAHPATEADRGVCLGPS